MQGLRDRSIELFMRRKRRKRRKLERKVRNVRMHVQSRRSASPRDHPLLFQRRL